MKNFNTISSSEIESALIMVNDMWNSLDSALNFQKFLPELSVCSAIIHILSSYRYRKRHVPIDSMLLQDCVSFVSSTICNHDLPSDILHNFKTIQKAFYVCCGYSKVKFNGRQADS